MTKKQDLPHISRRIVELREAKNLSQKDLGLLAGVTAPAITMWETGKRFPRGKNLKNLAKALGVPESAILDDTPPPVRASEVAGPDAQDFKDLISILPALNKDEINFLLGQARTFLSVNPRDVKTFEGNAKLKHKGGK